jgi:hypothetical protein
LGKRKADQEMECDGDIILGREVRKDLFYQMTFGRAPKELR